MHIFRTFTLGLAWMLISTVIFAEDVIKVNAMNYPAWVIRNHLSMALIPGSPLLADDLIRTGKNGRVQLQLADGSTIKLGESARFLIRSADIDEGQSESYLGSSFQVLRGAFRFTSSSFENRSMEHHLNLKIGAITAEVRGTDIWGRSNSEQDLLALLKGTITVITDEEPTIKMDQALSFYVKPRDEAPLYVDQVDPNQLQVWINDTELDRTQGIASQDGEWSVVLVSLTDMKNVNRTLKNYHERGFAAQRKSVIRDGKILHRLLLPGFISLEDAVIALDQITENLGIKDAWVWRKSITNN